MSFDLPKLSDDSIEGEILYPFGPPIYHTDIDHDIIDLCISEGRKNKEKYDHRKSLAGNFYNGTSVSFPYGNNARNKIDNLISKKIVDFTDILRKTYGNNWNDIDLFYKKESRLRLESIWINFQNKHDFNPPHNHTGLLSFIIFGDVDERIFTEGGPPTNSEKSGQVSFTFGERITPLQITMLNIKPYKGLMFIFPSSLKHYVTPFWIDSERISMSGNYVLEQSNIPQR